LEMSVEILRGALSNLPDQMDVESPLLSSSDNFFGSRFYTPQPVISSQDQLMCDIVDSL